MANKFCTDVVYLKAEACTFSPSLYFANIYLASKEKGKMFDLTERATQFGSTTASLLSGSTSKAGSHACLIVLLDSTCSSAICFSYVIGFFFASVALSRSFIFYVYFRKEKMK